MTAKFVGTAVGLILEWEPMAGIRIRNNVSSITINVDVPEGGGHGIEILRSDIENIDWFVLLLPLRRRMGVPDDETDDDEMLVCETDENGTIIETMHMTRSEFERRMAEEGGAR